MAAAMLVGVRTAWPGRQQQQHQHRQQAQLQALAVVAVRQQSLRCSASSSRCSSRRQGAPHRHPRRLPRARVPQLAIAKNGCGRHRRRRRHRRQRLHLRRIIITTPRLLSIPTWRAPTTSWWSTMMMTAMQMARRPGRPPRPNRYLQLSLGDQMRGAVATAAARSVSERARGGGLGLIAQLLR